MRPFGFDGGKRARSSGRVGKSSFADDDDDDTDDDADDDNDDGGDGERRRFGVIATPRGEPLIRICILHVYGG